MIFLSCSNEYPGFSKTRTGIYYKLLKIGAGSEKTQIDDFITVDISYQTIKDSLFFKAQRKVHVTEPEFKGEVVECFRFLSEGDSACFIIDGCDFFEKTLHSDRPSFIHEGSKIKVGIKILNIKDVNKFNQEKEAFLRWIEEFEELEKVQLKKYIQKENIGIAPTKSGFYKIGIVKGNDKIVERGDIVTIHYEGWFLNGKFFDSTRKRKQAFRFKFGHEWQVVKGVELAVEGMREEEKTIFVMPSDMAFGSKGSSTGIIPPFTSVIFKIELLRIEKK